MRLKVFLFAENKNWLKKFLWINFKEMHVQTFQRTWSFPSFQQVFRGPQQSFGEYAKKLSE